MDAGLYMYLFIAKQCDPRLLKDLFGKQKFLKGQVMYEDNLRSDTVLGEKIGNLIRVLRQYYIFNVDKNHMDGFLSTWYGVDRDRTMSVVSICISTLKSTMSSKPLKLMNSSSQTCLNSNMHDYCKLLNSLSML